MGSSSPPDAEDPLAGNYGEVPLPELQSKEEAVEPYTEVDALAEGMKERSVLVRGRAQAITAAAGEGEAAAAAASFVLVRGKGYKVRCVVTEREGSVSRQMVEFVASLTPESIIDVRGSVTVPSSPIEGVSQQVEIQVHQLYCISKPLPSLPFNLEDAARSSEAEIERAPQAGEQLLRSRSLNFVALDPRTPYRTELIVIQSQVETMFWRFLFSEGFDQITMPKPVLVFTEGGSAVVKLNYPACMAQLPELYMQMYLHADYGCVYEIGPAFSVEGSYICEYTGVHVELEIKKHYFEVMDIVDRMFVTMFDSLNADCKKELEAVGSRYHFKPLKDAGMEIDPLDHLNAEVERKLGQLVLEKYGTEFYILHRYPLAVRPFNTMPCYDDPAYSNSFNVFLRGGQIISGAQRVHDYELLAKRAEACGTKVKASEGYIESFGQGAPPHGGFRAALELVAIYFLGLDNVG